MIQLNSRIAIAGAAMLVSVASAAFAGPATDVAVANPFFANPVYTAGVAGYGTVDNWNTVNGDSGVYVAFAPGATTSAYVLGAPPAGGNGQVGFSSAAYNAV